MTNNALLFVDLSDNDPPHDLKAHYDAGYRTLVLKVTQGTSYVWGDSHKYAAEWHSFGKDAIVGHYHFLAPGSAASGTLQANYFWAHVKGDVRKGDVLIEDVETNGEDGAEHSSFQSKLKSLSRLERWTYGSPYFLRDHGITAQGTLLWLAEVAATWAFIPPGWKTVHAWQFTFTANGVPGMPENVDQSKYITDAPTKPKPVKPRNLPLHIRGPLHVVNRWLRWYTRAGTRPLSTSARGKMLDTGTLADKALKVGVKK